MAKQAQTTKKRWIFYLLAGIAFGIFDFYYQTWIFQLFPMATLAPILAVWLVPVVPIIVYEAKISGSIWLTAASSAFTWSVAVVAYYLFLGVKLILIGQASRAEMHISHRNDLYYWSNIQSFFESDVRNGITEWMGMALIGGSLVGLIFGFLMIRVKRRQQSS